VNQKTSVGGGYASHLRHPSRFSDTKTTNRHQYRASTVNIPRRNTNTYPRSTQTTSLYSEKIDKVVGWQISCSFRQHLKDDRKSNSGLNLSCCPNGPLGQRFSNLLGQRKKLTNANKWSLLHKKMRKEIYIHV
jgi:hypothetical protein